jgi:predicted ATPase
VGRKREIAAIAHLLIDANVRLVTILAPGGMGKTRLSLEVANTQLGHYADGVFFVPLAPLHEADNVVLAIAEHIGFTFHGEESPNQQLLGFLRDRSLLLVLDNLEHVLDAARYVDDILRTASGVQVLATSRERLGLQSETVYVLRGLDFPILDKLADLADYDAVKLFVAWASRLRPNFELQTDDLDSLTRICRLTAGMPLALELAAGWLDALSLEHIAAEIEQGIDILETDLRDVPERHRSIRATFDRTWQHLIEEDQQVFMRLSVFQGGFSREGAIAVAEAGRHNLRRLSHKALIEVLEDGRYNIHELLRQFGAEKLVQSDERAIIQSKHMTFFADFMAECQQDIRANRQLEAVELIDADFENVRLAWLNVLNQQAWHSLLKFLDSLWFYCEVRTRSQEGLALLQQAEQKLRAIPTVAESELILGGLLARLAWFYYDVGLAGKSVATSEEAIRILKQGNQPADLLAALYSRQAVALTRNQPEIGIRVLQEGLNLARSVGDRNWEGHFLVWSAISNIIRNDITSARPLAEAGLVIFESLGDRWGLMRAYTVLGDIEESQKNYERARYCFQESLAVTESFGHNFTIGANKTHLARLAFQKGNNRVAHQHLREALQALWDAGYLWASPFPLACAARMLAAQNDLVRAVEILATIDKHLTAFRRNDQIARTLHDEITPQLEAKQFAAAWSRGRQREMGILVVEMLRELQS